MFWMIAFLLAGQVAPQASPDGVVREWVSVPKATAITKCVQKHLPRGPSAQVVLQCESGAGNRLENCTLLESSEPGNAKVEAAAMCASKDFRVSTKRDGEVVTGVSVKLPLRLAFN